MYDLNFDFNGDLNKFAETQQKVPKKTYKDDPEKNTDIFWKPTYDKETVSGSAIIRFLPDPKGIPYHNFHKHFFFYPNPKGGKDRVYSNFCPNTLDDNTVGRQFCPICYNNYLLSKTGFPDDKATSNNRRKTTKYVANVYIVKDPANPANDGQIRLWAFGEEIKSIFDTISGIKKADSGDSKSQYAEMGIEFESKEDTRRFNPYHPTEGANFLIVIKPGKQIGKTVLPTYVSSEFTKNGTVDPTWTDEQATNFTLEAMKNSCKDLREYVTSLGIPNKDDINAELPFLKNDNSDSLPVEPPVQRESQAQASQPLPEPTQQASPQTTPSIPQTPDDSSSEDDIMAKLGLK